MSALIVVPRREGDGWLAFTAELAARAAHAGDIVLAGPDAVRRGLDEAAPSAPPAWVLAGHGRGDAFLGSDGAAALDGMNAYLTSGRGVVAFACLAGGDLASRCVEACAVGFGGFARELYRQVGAEPVPPEIAREIAAWMVATAERLADGDDPWTVLEATKETAGRIRGWFLDKPPAVRSLHRDLFALAGSLEDDFVVHTKAGRFPG